MKFKTFLALGMVTPSAYTLKLAMSASSSDSNDAVADTNHDKYEAVKRAAGSGRRLSDCVAYQANLVVDNKRRLSVSHCNNDKSLE